MRIAMQVALLLLLVSIPFLHAAKSTTEETTQNPETSGVNRRTARLPRLTRPTCPNCHSQSDPVGPPGPPGSPGAPGVTGPTGLGVTGAPGVQGATGAPGVQGATGAPGVQGATGAPGVQGATGAPGDTGAAGPPGGATGATGEPGQPGPTGMQGVTGPQGATGATGEPGQPGPTGIQGATGQGTTGTQGPPGACPSQVLNGNTSVVVSNTTACGIQPLLNFSVASPGTIYLGLEDSTVNIRGDVQLLDLPLETNATEFVVIDPVTKSLSRSQQGPQGPPGSPGSPGEPGTNGTQGNPGTPGTQGEEGPCPNITIVNVNSTECPTLSGIRIECGGTSNLVCLPATSNPGNIPPLTHVLFVDPLGASDGSIDDPYPTIQEAIDTIPPSVCDVFVLVLSPANYDEDLRINGTGRRIVITSWGPWGLGQFADSSCAPSGLARNVAYRVDGSDVNGARPSLAIGNWFYQGEGMATHQSYTTGARISGSISVEQNVSNSFVELSIQAELFAGIPSGNRFAIDATEALSVNLYLYRSRFHGLLNAPTTFLQWADRVQFTGIIVERYSRIQNSRFDESITLGSALNGLIFPEGIINSYFSSTGSKTFSGPPGSLRLDGNSNYWFNTNGWSLAGGATKVIQEDLELPLTCPQDALNGNSTVLVTNSTTCGTQPLLTFSLGQVLVGEPANSTTKIFHTIELPDLEPVPDNVTDVVFWDTASGKIYHGNVDITQGPPGPQGPPGLNGTDGVPGVPGTDGVPGAPGEPGVNGTCPFNCTTVPGPPGPQGEEGPQGIQGPAGSGFNASYGFFTCNGVTGTLPINSDMPLFFIAEPPLITAPVGMSISGSVITIAGTGTFKINYHVYAEVTNGAITADFTLRVNGVNSALARQSAQNTGADGTQTISRPIDGFIIFTFTTPGTTLSMRTLASPLTLVTVGGAQTCAIALHQIA